MNKLLKQILQFIGVSGLGWLLDFGTYTILFLLLGHPNYVNLFSSFVGFSFTFYFSTRWIFKNTGRVSLRVKYIGYIIYQVGLIVLASWMIGGLSGWICATFSAALLVQLSGVIAKILVTPFTMLCNFCVMRVLIEKI